jgi:hypothetical protein
MADEEVVETDSTSSTEEATVEEPTSVPNKVSLKVGEKQYNFEPDAFQKVADAYEKAQKWETSYHKKGEQLNKLRDELYTKEKEVADNKAVLEEYRKIKKAFEANPSAYAAVQKALNEGQPTLNPQIQELEKKQHEIENNLAYDKAIRALSKEYEDFNEEGVRNFMLDYDFWKPGDVLKLGYYASKGAQMPDLIEQAKAQVVMDAKTKKGLPPIGSKTTPTKALPKTLREQWEMAKKRIASEGPLF